MEKEDSCSPCLEVEAQEACGEEIEEQHGADCIKKEEGRGSTDELFPCSKI